MTGTIQKFDFSVNLLQALLWQYNEATNLQTLLEEKSEWYAENQTAFWESFITDIFDIRTANQFGLALWGIILNIPLYVNNPPSSAPRWGYASDSVNFGFGNFEPLGGSSYQLPLETQRKAIQLRYTQLTCAGTVPEINRALAWIFADLGTAFLFDYNNMNQLYVFNFPLTYDLTYLFDNYDILPRPATVGSAYYDNTLEYFGFAPDSVNFGHGGFYGGVL